MIILWRALVPQVSPDDGEVGEQWVGLIYNYSLGLSPISDKLNFAIFHSGDIPRSLNIRHISITNSSTNLLSNFVFTPGIELNPSSRIRSIFLT